MKVKAFGRWDWVEGGDPPPPENRGMLRSRFVMLLGPEMFRPDEVGRVGVWLDQLNAPDASPRRLVAEVLRECGYNPGKRWSRAEKAEALAMECELAKVAYPDVCEAAEAAWDAHDREMATL